MSKLDERSEESAKAHMEAILTEINGGTKVTMSKDCEKFLLEYLTSFVEQITVDSMQYARHRGGEELVHLLRLPRQLLLRTLLRQSQSLARGAGARRVHAPGPSSCLRAERPLARRLPARIQI